MSLYQSPYRSDELYHFGLKSLRPLGTGKGKEWSKHKYLKKIDGRYFYTPQEIAAYAKRGARAVSRGINSAKAGIYDAAGGKYKKAAGRYSSAANASQRRSDVAKNSVVGYERQSRTLTKRLRDNETAKRNANTHSPRYKRVMNGINLERQRVGSKLNDVDKKLKNARRTQASAATRAQQNRKMAARNRKLYENSIAGKYDRTKANARKLLAAIKKRLGGAFKSVTSGEAAKRARGNLDIQRALARQAAKRQKTAASAAVKKLPGQARKVFNDATGITAKRDYSRKQNRADSFRRQQASYQKKYNKSFARKAADLADRTYLPGHLHGKVAGAIRNSSKSFQATSRARKAASRAQAQANAAKKRYESSLMGRIDRIGRQFRRKKRNRR